MTTFKVTFYMEVIPEDDENDEEVLELATRIAREEYLPVGFVFDIEQDGER